MQDDTDSYRTDLWATFVQNIILWSNQIYLFAVVKILILRLLTETNIRIISHVIFLIMLVRVTIVRNLLPITGTEDVRTEDLLDLINSIHINIHLVTVTKSPDRYESRGSSVSPNGSSELDRNVRERQLWSPTSSPNRGHDREKMLLSS